MADAVIPTRADGTVNPGVYRPSMFVCATTPANSYVLYDARPGADIAASLLEEASDWWQALRSLPAGTVPDGVMAAMESLHSAACGWTEWLAHTGPTT